MSFTDRYSVSNTMLRDGNSPDCIAGTSEQPMQRRLNCAQLEDRGAAAVIQGACVYTQLSVLPNEQLFGKLYESLALETKFQPSLFLPEDSNNGEVTVGARDGAAHVLRCLKMWYDFPSDVLFVAVNLVDRFLTKMRVRPKHMACISVGSFLLAVRQLKLNIADTDDLVAISQCRCTSGDVERMSTIVASKLGVQMEAAPITPLTFLRIFHIVLHRVAVELNLQAFFESTMIFHDLVARLEILACEASCASMRASELALALICTHLDEMIAAKLGSDNDHVQGLVQYAIQLQNLCKITEHGFFETHKIVVNILEHYNGQQKLPHRQRLVWKLSSRTLRVLRPTDRLTSHLPTIEEDNNHNPLRTRTGSVCSEEGEDWPTSPILPIYEK
ncbi:cyclin G [Sitodiplosis mosellana]|uniref:cyclin G n=1 Tax=Sitodiplosis mosellana TaxID=263140 RepID=UPI002443C2F4|nr:cyclin G [Sitodiplosis mosellana]